MNLAASRRRCASPPYSVSSGYGRDADQDAHGLLVTKIVAKVAAYTYGCYINRMLGRPQGRTRGLRA